jgi:hypothetical protein
MGFRIPYVPAEGRQVLEIREGKSCASRILDLSQGGIDHLVDALSQFGISCEEWCRRSTAYFVESQAEFHEVEW